MSSRLTSAIVLGLAIVAGPMGAATVWAQTPPATASSLQATISSAARAAASQPGFSGLTAQQKLAAIQASISAALAATGASPTVIRDALIQAVSNGTISGGVAVQVASVVAPEMANAVLNSNAVQTQMAASGQTITATASTDTTTGAVSVLVSLQGASTPGGSDANGPTTTPAPYDPCDGVVGDYCGS